MSQEAKPNTESKASTEILRNEKNKTKKILSNEHEVIHNLNTKTTSQENLDSNSESSTGLESKDSLDSINFLDYCLFITFFPQLIAGPIVHHREMMPQFARLSRNASLTQDTRILKSIESKGSLESKIDLESNATDSINLDSQKSVQDQRESNSITQELDTKHDPNTHQISCRQDFGGRIGALECEARELPKAVMTEAKHEQSPILPQKPTTTFCDYESVAKGLFIFAIGLFKKVCIADSFAKWANAGFRVVENGGYLNIFESWVTSLSYTFELYFDFSGYCDMAIGLGLLFGIMLPINFNSPYKALNIADFWRRWHITLGRFLKEYVYIPLGGNRNSPKKARVNSALVRENGSLVNN